MPNEINKRTERASALAPDESWSAIGKVPPSIRTSIRETRRNELMQSICNLEQDNEVNLNRLLSALDRIRDMEPKSAIESILAEQIEIAREYSLRASYAANLAEGNTTLQDVHLKRMERLNGSIMKMAAAMDKHRGKANQKVVVEHVNVAAGAQAIVGQVNTNRDGGRDERPGQ